MRLVLIAHEAITSMSAALRIRISPRMRVGSSLLIDVHKFKVISSPRQPGNSGFKEHAFEETSEHDDGCNPAAVFGAGLGFVQAILKDLGELGVGDDLVHSDFEFYRCEGSWGCQRGVAFDDAGASVWSFDFVALVDEKGVERAGDLCSGFWGFAEIFERVA
jgi:hypothetical protein